MNEVKQLWLLQRVDQELAEKTAALQQVESKLGNREELENARLAQVEEQQKMLALKKEQRDQELEAQDLGDKLTKLDGQLYAGGKGSKELTAIQQEIELVKGRRKAIEDKMLDLMVRVETVQAEVQARAKDIEEQEKEWGRQQKALKAERAELKSAVAAITHRRTEAAAPVSPATLTLYEGIRTMRAQAVAKVDRGMCQGCRLMLPVSQWQRIRSGALVRCSSCSRILCLE